MQKFSKKKKKKERKKKKNGALSVSIQKFNPRPKSICIKSVIADADGQVICYSWWSTQWSPLTQLDKIQSGNDRDGTYKHWKRIRNDI